MHGKTTIKIINMLLTEIWKRQLVMPVRCVAYLSKFCQLLRVFNVESVSKPKAK